MVIGLRDIHDNENPPPQVLHTYVLTFLPYKTGRTCMGPGGMRIGFSEAASGRVGGGRVP